MMKRGCNLHPLCYLLFLKYLYWFKLGYAPAAEECGDDCAYEDYRCREEEPDRRCRELVLPDPESKMSPLNREKFIRG